MPNKRLKFSIAFIVALVLVNCIVDVIEASHSGRNDDDYDYDDDDIKNWLSPWEVQVLPPEPRKNFYRDLRSCMKTLTRRCNKRLYNYVFLRQVIRRPCCKKVDEMKMGCLESLAWVLNLTFQYNAKRVDERFKEVLNMCSGFY